MDLLRRFTSSNHPLAVAAGAQDPGMYMAVHEEFEHRRTPHRPFPTLPPALSRECVSASLAVAAGAQTPGMYMRYMRSSSTAGRRIDHSRHFLRP